MSLQSSLFKGNQALEACQVHNSAHVTRGASGRHVALIQKALQLLIGAKIHPTELAGERYGPSTAAAVLTYKKARNIINRAYQSQPDDIVGIMTITSMDLELSKKPVPPPPPIFIRSRFVARDALQGFDPAPGNPKVPGEAFQMVPVSGSREVRLIGGGNSDAAGLAVTLVGGDGGPIQTAARFTELTSPAAPDRIFSIQGLSQGGSRLEVRSGGTLVGLLQIAVLQKRQLSMSFKILRDSAGHATTRVGCSNIPEWVKTAKEILSQANIEPASVNCTGLQIPGDAGATPDPLTLSQQLLDLAKKGSFSVIDAKCHVFFVWDLPELEPDEKTLGRTTIFILIDQESSSSSSVLAHEAGHFLGLEHESALGDPDNLMIEGATGKLLNKDQILKVNLHPKN